MDKEEAKENQQEIESEGNRIEHTMDTPGWELIEKSFQEEIMDLQSIKNVDDSDMESAFADMKARNAAIEKMMSWWKKIHGKVERKDFNASKAEPDDHIEHHFDE